MRLCELAFACYIYGRISGYDASYRNFLASTNPVLDLGKDAHRKALLEWLNDWGCRQFAKEYHELASKGIKDWYSEFGGRLPSPEKTLLELSGDEIAVVGRAYEGLACKVASKRRNARREFVVTIGSTGAAKILFAVRPNALLPWDEPIRKQLTRSYVDYLGIAKTKLQELDEDCQKFGCKLSDLPNLVDRPTSTLVKLIDEYFWVTITNSCPAPSTDVFSQWAHWNL